MIGLRLTLDYETKLAADKSPSLSGLMDPVKPIDEIEARIGREDLVTGLSRDDDLCFLFIEQTNPSLLPVNIRNDPFLLIYCINTLILIHLAKHRSHRPSP
jgi:hypothetical protein